MLGSITLLLLTLVVSISFYLAYKYITYRPKGFPPGPPRLPLFGSYLFMMLSNFKYLHKAVWNFTKWYNSDIVGFYMGPYPVVAVHNAEAVREVLYRTEFDGRPKIYVAAIRQPENILSGIFFQDGLLWKEQRRFILRYLRDFGFGRRFEELECVIREEITDMLDLIHHGPKYDHEKEYVAEGGMRILQPYFFNFCSLNSYLYILTKERVPRSEQAESWKLIYYGMQFQRTADDYGKMLSIMPWIRYFFPNWSSYNTLSESSKFMYYYFEQIIERHIKTYDPSHERNFIDMYINEVNRNPSAFFDGNEDPKFTHAQFVMSMVDFAFPAFSAIGTQLSLLIQYFLLLPEVQERIYQEINNVVGTGRLPCLEDRKMMHYTEATIREILRIETLVPSDVPHKALVDTELKGYTIPKETIIIPALYAYHNDGRIWNDPQEFKPERFLDKNGKLSLKKDISLPFGAGKRLCAGETFARNILFLITTAMCQNFQFILSSDDSLPDLTTNLSGLIISPKNFWVQLSKRKTI